MRTQTEEQPDRHVSKRVDSKRRRRIVLIVSLLVIGVLFLLSRQGEKLETNEIELSAKTEAGPLKAVIKDVGSIEPIKLIEIKSEQGGTIKKILVEEGNRVNKGQKLVIIQQETGFAGQLTQARTGVRLSETNLNIAKSKYNRYKNLYQEGIVSKDQFEDYKKNYENALLRYQSDKKQLWLMLEGSGQLVKEIGKALDESQKPMLEQSIVVSPIDGIVTKINLDEGEQVTSGVSFFVSTTPIMEIADVSQMQVKAYINEVDIAKVEIGQKVNIMLDAMLDQTFHGKVAKITPKGQVVSNIMSYEVIINVNEKEPAMLPGMTADVDIITGVKENALYIPIEFIHKEGQKSYVYLKEETERLKRYVKPGIKTELYVEILKGIEPTDTVYRYEEMPEKKDEKPSAPH